MLIIMNPTFQGSWLALQVAGGTLVALLVLVLAVVVGSKFFGQQGPPHLPSSLFQLPPRVKSSLELLQGQKKKKKISSVSAPDVENNLAWSATMPPPPPSSILYSHDDEHPVAYNPPKSHVAWN